jgi:hypothetical protein
VTIKTLIPLSEMEVRHSDSPRDFSFWLRMFQEDTLDETRIEHIIELQLNGNKPYANMLRALYACMALDEAYIEKLTRKATPGCEINAGDRGFVALKRPEEKPSILNLSFAGADMVFASEDEYRDALMGTPRS